MDDALSDEIVIRFCAPGDRRPCALLFETIMRATFPQDDPATYARARFEHSVAGEEIWVAASPAGAVGFVSYWRADAFIHFLVVAEGWRRVGIGKALLRRAITTAAGPVQLKCHLDNSGACRFYEESGWREVGRDAAAAEPYVRYRCWEPTSP